jgi:hypothetical protein
MLRNNRKKGSTLIALLAVVAALAAGTAGGVASDGRLVPAASWSE